MENLTEIKTDTMALEKLSERDAPQFPDFKKIEMSDREIIHSYFKAYQPEVSELKFTNLFIWRHYYQFEWSILDGFLLILVHTLNFGYHFMQPVGPGSREKIIPFLLDWLEKERDEYEPRIERVDQRVIDELGDLSQIQVESLPDHADYVYSTQDLIQLAGRKYHAKKNHINRFNKQHDFEYQAMTPELVNACIHILKRWCNWRECDKSPIMRAEFEAVHEALLHFNQLELDGGVILVDNSVVAFALGEMLNKQTAVVHAEKVDPNIRELFAVINQQFCENAYSEVPFMNREQDLGIAGLRRAKRSYHPVRMVEKYRITKA